MALTTIKFALLFAFCVTSVAGQCPTFTTDNNFQIEKVSENQFPFIFISENLLFQYTGLWYDVARLPNIFLTGVTCDNTTYTLNSDGSLTVLEESLGAQGQPIVETELLRVADPAVPAAFILYSGDGGKHLFPVLRPSQTGSFQ